MSPYTNKSATLSSTSSVPLLRWQRFVLLITVLLFVSLTSQSSHQYGGSMPMFVTPAAAQDITAVDVRFFTNFNYSTTSILSLFTPTFTLGNYGPYTLSSSAAFTNAFIQVKVSYSTTTAVVTMDRGVGSAASDTVRVTATDVWSRSLDLPLLSPSTNSIRIVSSLDLKLGNYTFILGRSQALMSDLSFKATNATVEAILATSIEPAFALGSTMTYTVYAHSTCTAVLIKSLGFTVPITSPLLTNPSPITGLNLTMEFLGTSRFNFSSNFTGVSLPLLSGNNILRIKVPTDGWYIINIWRYPGSWTIGGFPTSLYVGQTASGATFFPNGVSSPIVTVTPSASASDVKFSPTSLAWNRGSITLSLTFVASATPGTLVLSFTLGSTSARQFNPIASISITILPQDTFAVTTPPLTIYALQWAPVPIYVTPSALPDPTLSGVKLNIQSTSNLGPLSLNPNFLYFDIGSTNNQSFYFQGANTTDSLYMYISFSIDASTPVQFKAPDPLEILVFPLAHFQVDGLGSPPGSVTLSGGQSVTVTFTPDTVPYPEDGSGNSYVNLNLASLAGSFEPNQLVFHDLSPQQVTYTAPHFFLPGNTGTKIDEFYITYTGQDAAHYAVPPFVGVPVFSSGFLVFTNANDTVVVGGTQTFSVALSEVPIGGAGVGAVAVYPVLQAYGTVLASGGLGTVAPVLVTYETTNWNTPQTFVFKAPPTATVISLYSNFGFSGNNGFQYMNHPRQNPPNIIVQGTCSIVALPSATLFTNQVVTVTVQFVGMAPEQLDVQVMLNNSLRVTSGLLSPATYLDFNGQTPVGSSSIGSQIFQQSFTITAPKAVPAQDNGVVGITLSLNGTNAYLLSGCKPSYFNFTVLPQSTLTLTNYPTKLYTAQSSGTISIVFGEATSSGYTAGNALGVAVKNVVSTPVVVGQVTLTQPGTISPSSTFNLNSNANSPLTFVYTAGLYSGQVTLSLQLSKGDAPHYNIVPSSLVIQILDRASFNLVDIPTNIDSVTGKIGVQSKFTVKVSLSQAPVVDSTYTGNVVLTSTVSGGTATPGVTYASMDPASLSFTSTNWNVPQPVTLMAPNQASSFTITYAVTGSNAPQYLTPSVMTFQVFANVTYPAVSSSLYTSQVLDPLIFTATGVTNPNIKLQVALFPAGVGTLSPASGLVDLSSGSNTVIYSTPTTLPVSFAGTITLSFSLVAGTGTTGATDLAKFGPIMPSSLTISLAQQSGFLFEGKFDNLLVNGLSKTLALTPLVAPQMQGITLFLNANITVNDPTLGYADAGVFFQGTTSNQITSITFNPGSTTRVQFQYQAPAVASSITIFFTYGGSPVTQDNYHFALPAPFSAAINPLGTFQILMPQNLYYGQTATFSYLPSLIPTVGVNLQISPSQGTIAVLTNNVPGAYSSGTTLSWVGNNAQQLLSYQAVANANPSTTTVQFSYSSTGSDSTNLPTPLSSTLLLLPHGGWNLGTIPNQLTPGITWKLSVAPNIPITGGTVHLVMRSNGAAISPSELLFTTGSDSTSLQYFSVQVTGSGVVRCNFTMSYSDGTITSLLAPAAFSVVSVAPISVLPAAGNTIPTSLYSTELSAALSIYPSTLATILPNLGLTVTFYSNASSPLPASYWGSSGVPVATFVPTSVSFVNNNPLSFSIQAPSITADAGSITVSVSFTLSDLAANLFTAPSILTFAVIPQSILQIAYSSPSNSFVSVTTVTNGKPTTTTNNLYAYTTVAWTISQVDPSAQSTGGFGMAIGLSGGTGTLNVTSFYLLPARLNWFTFSYVAPITVQSSVNIVFSSSGGDAAHFMLPSPIVFNTLGPLLFDGCSTYAQSVIVSGAPDDATMKSSASAGSFFNGLYVVGAPINGQPHYILSPTSGGASTVNIHLFFLPSDSTPFPVSSPPSSSKYPAGTWVLDTDTTSGATHSKALYTTAYSPILQSGGVAPNNIQWYTAAGTLVTGLTVSCGVDCANIGTSQSLEADVCFNGQALLTTQSVVYPSTCPVSCGLYAPGIIATCSLISTLWKPSVSIPLLAMQTTCSGSAAGAALPSGSTQAAITAATTAASCTYFRTLTIVQTCGLSFQDGAGTIDLTNVMTFPTTCSSSCMVVWLTYYQKCVSASPSANLWPNSPVNIFQELCLATQVSTSASSFIVNPIPTVIISDIHSDRYTLSWAPAVVPIGLNPGMNYLIDQSSTNSFVTGASTTTSFSTTEFAYVVSGFSSITTSFFRIRSTPVSGVASSVVYSDYSVMVSATTAVSPLQPPTNINFVLPMTYVPAAPGVPASYYSLLTWSPVTSTYSSTPVQYRVLLVPGQRLSPTNTVYGSPYTNVVQLYVGTDTTMNVTSLVPLTSFQIQISAADTSVSSRHDLTNTITIYNQFPSLLSTPDCVSFLPVGVNDVSLTTGITLNWAPPVFCAGLCSAIGYEVQYFSVPLSQVSASVPDVGSGLSFQPSAAALSLLYQNATMWTQGRLTPFSTTLAFSTAIGQVDMGYAFRIRTTTSVTTVSPSPWSFPLFVALPPGLAVISPTATNFQFIAGGTYEKAFAIWDNTAGISNSKFAPIDMVHFQLTPTATGSQAAVPSATIPVLHFYFTLASLSHDMATGFYELEFSQLTSLNNVPLSYATNYSVSWEMHTTGQTSSSGSGWSGLQTVLSNYFIGSTVMSSAVVLSVIDAPPSLVSISASDTNQIFSGALTPGQQIIFTFSKATNKPAVDTPTQFNQLLSCTPASSLTGITYQSSWSADGSQLSMVFLGVNAGATGPIVGSFTCTIVHTTLAAPQLAGLIWSGTTLNNLIDRTALTATFTGCLSEGSIVYLQPYYVPVVVPEDSVNFPLIIQTRANIGASDATSTNPVAISLSVQGSYGSLLTYPMDGTGTPSRTITITGFTYQQILDPSVSPLNKLIGFTPRSRFVGTDAIVVTLTTNVNKTTSSIPIRTESTTIVFSIKTVNHAPVLTSPYSTLASPLYLPSGIGLKNPLYLSNSIFNIADEDDPNQLKTVTLTLAAGTSATARFVIIGSGSIIPADVASSAQPGVAVPSLRLSGSLNEILSLLSAISFFDTASDPDYPSTSQAIHVHVEDNGSGIKGAASLSADLQVYYVSSSETTAPVVQSCAFSLDFSEILFNFDTNVRMRGDTQLSINQLITSGNNGFSKTNWVPQSSPSYDCSRIFDATSVAKFGAGARCYFFPMNTLHVVMGYAPTVTPKSSLTFLTSPGIGKSGSLATNAVSGSYVASLPPATAQALFPAPQVFISGPANISMCDDLVLRAQLVNTSMHAGLMFYWSSMPNNNILPDVLDMTKDTVSIPSASIRTNTAYRFQLYVVNIWTGVRSSTAQWIVYKYTNPIPQMSINGLSVRHVSRGDTVVLSVNANISNCLTGLSLSSQQMTFAWTVTPALGTGNTLDPLLVSSRSITIQPFTLAAGVSYTFYCTASMTSNPAWTNNIVISVNVISAPLQVSIDGGVAQTVPSSSPIMLQGSAYDPEAQASTTFQHVWTCQILHSPSVLNPLQPQACFNQLQLSSLTSGYLSTIAVTQSNTASNSSQSITIPAGALAPNLYLFTLTASKGSGRFSGSFNVTVFVAPSSASPSVTIAPSSQVLNPSDTLILTAALMPSAATTAANGAKITYSYLWSISPSSAIIPAFYDYTITSGWTSPTLVINAGAARSNNAFPAGAHFRMRCTITNELNGLSSSAESDITITRPPSSGIFFVTPSTGISGVTTFTLSAQGFVNTHAINTATNYGMTFRYYLQGNDSALIGLGYQPGSPVDTTELYLPTTITTAQTLTLVLRISTGGGVYAMYTTTVVVTPNTASGGSNLQSLTSNFLLQRLQAGTNIYNSEGSFNAYLFQTYFDHLSSIQNAYAAYTPAGSNAWMPAGSPFSLQARCNILAHPYLSALSSLSSTVPVYNSINNAASPLSMSYKAWVQVQFFNLFNLQSSALLLSNLGLSVKLCASFGMTAHLSGYAYQWTTSTSSAFVTLCTSVLTAVSGNSASLPIGSGAKFASALSWYGCAAGNHPFGREKAMCFNEKQQLIRDLLVIFHSIWHVRRVQVAGGISQTTSDATFFSNQMTNLNAILDLHTKYILGGSAPALRALNQGSYLSTNFMTPMFYYPDCQIPAMVSREAITNSLTMNFAANDNTTIVVQPALSSQTSTPYFPASSFQDTRAILFLNANPYSTATVPNSFPLLSAVLSVGRSSPYNNMVISIPYAGVANNCNPVCAKCNNTACVLCNLACLPTCLVLDQGSNLWRLDATVTTGSRYGWSNDLNTLTADCTVSSNASPSLVIGVFGATPAFVGITWPVAGSTTGSNNPVSSSTGGTGTPGTTGNQGGNNGTSGTTSSSTGGSNVNPGGGSTGRAASTGGNVASSTGVNGTSNNTGGVPTYSSSTGVAGATSYTAVTFTMALRIAYENISSQLTTFNNLLKVDLGRASGVDPVRMAVTSVDPSGIVKRTPTTVTKNAAVPHVSKAGNATSNSSSTTTTTTVIVVTSTEVTVGMSVMPSQSVGAVTGDAFIANLTAQLALGRGPIYDGVFSRYAISANFTAYAVQFCSSTLTYQTSCGDVGGTSTVDDGGSGGKTLFGFSLLIGILIICGGFVFLILLVLMIWCMCKYARTETDFKNKSPEEKEAIMKKAVEKRKKAAAEAAEKERKKKEATEKKDKKKDGKDAAETEGNDKAKRAGNTSGSASPISAQEPLNKAVELPDIEPQWESAIFVPKHLKKMNAAVTARTAGHEAPDAHEAEPIVLKNQAAPKAAATAAAATGGSKKQQTNGGIGGAQIAASPPPEFASLSGEQSTYNAAAAASSSKSPPAPSKKAQPAMNLNQLDDLESMASSDHSDDDTAAPVMQVERARPLTSSLPKVADTRMKRTAPVNLTPVNIHTAPQQQQQQQQPQRSMAPQPNVLTPAQRAAQFERQKAEQQAAQAARMNSPSSSTGMNPRMMANNGGMGVGGFNAPQRLPAGGVRVHPGAVTSPMNRGGMAVNHAVGTPQRFPTRAPGAAGGAGRQRLTPQQLAAQIYNGHY